jgi:hypothetical protein
MGEPDKRPVTMEELLVSSLAQADALAKLVSTSTNRACFIAVSSFGRDGQFTDALKIMLVTCTVRQAHRIEHPASIGDQRIQGGFASALCPYPTAGHP